LFGSFDGIAASWRIVDGIVDSAAAPREYDPGSHGPRQAAL
jgi:hypothetical protein